ncbi:MAG: tetratricopeptide repeat protein [Spirochaetaceae bacterium]|nr:MAG: tetratricopeptide repeat protein [Spirochaetaceae bacterium]
MPKSVLTRARQLFRRRRFSQAIRLLESQIFRYRNNPEFYTLLGSACLHTGDFGGAESYLRRAEQLKEEDVTTQLGLAAIAFKRGQIEDALKNWLKVIDLDPGNRKARNALNALRKDANWEGSVIDAAAIKIRNVLPSPPVSQWAWIAPVIGVCVFAVLTTAYFFLLPLVGSQRRQPRPGVEEIVLSLNQPLIAQVSEPQSSFTLSERQISDSFELTKEHLLDYRDNLAILEINKLLRSNASIYVKEKARLMKTFVRDPDFSTVKDPFPYPEVRSDPGLYSDCYVVWKGKVANVRIGESEITFDLLVGYEDETELLGLVPVSLSFAAAIENGDGIEVLGKVQVESGQIRLQGISIHRLYRQG